MAIALITFLSSLAIAVSGPGTTRIELNMTPEQRTQLAQPTKTTVFNTEIKVFEAGRHTVHSYVTLQSRGQSSIVYPRKNLKIESVYKDEEGKTQKTKVGPLNERKIILSAGAADPLVARNMVVYRLYDLVGIPTLNTSYAEVVINGVSNGLYMASQKPDEFIMKNLNGEAVFRRGYNDVLQLEDAKKSLSDEQVEVHRQALKQVFRDLKKLRGQELLNSLERRMNFRGYLRLVAMNYLVKNGDFFDELYLFSKTQADGSLYFDVFPWDLDDTFAAQMHLARIPGYANNGRSERMQKQMLYSFESRIDQAISQDPVLLNEYFEVLGEVVNTLSDSKIDQVFATVESMLSPYIGDPAILAMGVYDESKVPYTPEGIRQMLSTNRDALKQSLPIIRNELEIIKTEPETRAKRMNKLNRIINSLLQKLAAKWMYK